MSGVAVLNRRNLGGRLNGELKKLERESKAANDKLLDTLPHRIDQHSSKAMKKTQARLKRIVDNELNKIKYESGRKVFDANKVEYRQFINPRKTIRGKYSAIGRFPLTYTSYGRERELMHVLSREKEINIYFDGGVNKSGRTDGAAPFPAYLTNEASYLYKPSKYPQKYDSYIYMPYIINNQPIARDYVYWTSKTEQIGYYVKNTKLHNKGDPKYERKVSRLRWYDQSAKGFVNRMVNKMNQFKKEEYTVKIYAPTIEGNEVVAKKRDIRYTVQYKATANKIYK